MTSTLALAEVITSAEFHPSHCNTLAYSSSKGSIRLIDLRQSALCDNHSKLSKQCGVDFSCGVTDIWLQCCSVQLCDLYENDSIFDKFECCLSGDGLRVATGSYSNLLRVFGCAAQSTEATTLEATKNPMRKQVQTPARPVRSLANLSRVVKRGTESAEVDSNGNSYDSTTKLVHLAWHPTENSLACAAANSLYVYYA
ncbi:hypothetical protein HPP92_007615 [Vanilla planifolia]|uniref:Uncharacterized protein n=1 Tax=Vanilla planifolia TaxID=51239 RepID=A0A835RGZ9_VANPL|nr:hypothetical protein HPP92_007615 [Vanilla planifolia]